MIKTVIVPKEPDGPICHVLELTDMDSIVLTNGEYIHRLTQIDGQYVWTPVFGETYSTWDCFCKYPTIKEAILSVLVGRTDVKVYASKDKKELLRFILKEIRK